MSIAIVFLAAAAIVPVTPTPTGQSIIQKCWEHNAHAAMTDCVVGTASTAHSELADLERSVRGVLLEQRKPALVARFDSAAVSYQRYKAQQCALAETLASAGNGGTEIGLACEAALDLARIVQLKSDRRWLEPGA